MEKLGGDLRLSEIVQRDIEKSSWKKITKDVYTLKFETECYEIDNSVTQHIGAFLGAIPIISSTPLATTPIPAKGAVQMNVRINCKCKVGSYFGIPIAKGWVEHLDWSGSFEVLGTKKATLLEYFNNETNAYTEALFWNLCKGNR